MKNWILMVVAFIVMIGVNALGSTGHINGQSQQEISDRINVLFTPDGYVFSIWSVIYVLVAVWLIIQFLRVRKQRVLPSQFAYLFIGTCMLNILWLITWHYEIFWLAQLMMFALLINLIVLYMKYPKGDKSFGGRLPFSFYTGWISVATIANMAYTLKHYDVSLGISEVAGTIGLLVIAVLLSVATLFARWDQFFALVFVWAIIGIGMANDTSSLVLTAYVCAGIVAVAVVVSLFTTKNITVNKGV